MSRGRDGDDAARRGELGAIRWAFVQDPGDALSKLVLLAMSTPANASFLCYMSHGKIAAKANCHRRTVMRKIQRLLMMGLLKDVSADHLDRPTKTYRLCVDTE